MSDAPVNDDLVEITVDGEELLILSESEIFGVVEG